MFDFQWSEIALIGVVALVLIGPKDLPIAIRAITDVIKKMRRMAGELQTHVDDMVRDTDLKEARETFRDLRGFNIRNQVMRAVDDDGSLRKTLTERPLADQNILATRMPGHGLSGQGLSGGSLSGGGLSGPVMMPSAAPPTSAPPAFIPPVSARSAATKPPPEPVSPPPAFIPPTAARPEPAPSSDPA